MLIKLRVTVGEVRDSDEKTYDDGYFDFIYVDARNDFKGVSLDLAAFWT